MATILLADDHAATRQLLSERLSLDGYKVVAIEDAAGAYERFSARRPDLVIASAVLPQTGGKHLLTQLRGVGRRVPTIVYDTGHRGAPRGVKAVLDLGANGYLPDPTRHEELRKKVAELLAPRPEKPRRPPAPYMRERAVGVQPAGSGGPERASADRRSGLRVDYRAGEAAASAPSLSQGVIEPGRLLELLLEIHRDEITGTLELSLGDEDTNLVRFEDGRPTGVLSTDPRASLVRWMSRTGRIDDARAAEILDLSVQEGLSQSGALVAAGEIEPGPLLMELLQAHARDVLSDWLAARRGRFALTAKATSPRDIGPSLCIPPLPLVREVAETGLPVSLFASQLTSRLDMYPHRVEGFRRHLGAMALSPKETTFAMKITGHLTARELLTTIQGDLKQALIILWFLDRLDAIAFSESRVVDEDEVYHQRTAAAGRKKKPLPPEERERLCEEALRIITASYFGVLGLDITAGINEIEQAYHEVATRFHPDSWEAFDLEGLDDLLLTVLDRAGAAYRILSIEEKRRGYLSFLLSRHESNLRRKEIVADAEVALRRGLKRLESGDAAGAEMAFREAVELNAKEPAYLAHLALARFKSSHGPPEVRAVEARPLLKKALSLDPGHEQAHLVSALVEQACGQRDIARAHVLSTLRANPKNEAGKALLSRINRPR